MDHLDSFQLLILRLVELPSVVGEGGRFVRSQLRETLQLGGRVLVIGPVWHPGKSRETCKLGQFVTLFVMLNGGRKGAPSMACQGGN